MKTLKIASVMLLLFLGFMLQLPYYAHGESADSLKKKAAKGDAYSEYALGKAYFYGKGVSLDYAKAVHWFRMSAAQGNAYGENSLGNAYQNGKGVPLDYVKAVHWFRLAAAQGDALAENNLGYAYQNGKGVTLDYAKAVHWYRLAAAQGDAYGENALGYAYQNGKGVPLDYVKAVHWFRMSAAQGNAFAEDSLGYAYLYGKGVSLDYAKAVHWLRLSAAQGNAYGENNLGYAYQNGKGVPLDYAKAVHWFRLAAAQGDALAENSLGYAYQNGKGVTLDYAKAVHWYRLAAAQGDAAAENGVGLAYLYGKGVPLDYAKAVHWFRLAAAQGDAYGENNLGYAYQNGKGVTLDYAKAVHWYGLAAAQGDALAENNLRDAVNAKDNNGDTPLHKVLNKDAAEVLIDNGADVNAKDNYGDTPLFMAFNKDIAEVLIGHGADVNARNNQGDTPLYNAAEEGNTEIAQTLIAHGADVNAKDNTGDTPLHEAAEGGQADIVKLLIAHGADINARDNAGRTPLQVANSKEIVALLQSAMLNQSGNKYDLLKKLLAQFKGHSENDALRLSIIKLVKSLNPAPAVPREAQNLDGQAQYIFQHAQSEDDYMKAARKYLKAVEIAPWVPDYYYNLCVILDKTQFIKQAIHACRLYLDTTPDASGNDASRIQTLVSGLEYAKKKAVENLDGRTEYHNNTGIDELYRLGGISGNVMGHDVAIRLAVDWQAAPPRYQLLVSCIEGNQVYLWDRDIVTTDTGINMCSSSTNMHLIINPAGEGFVELADWSGNTYIRATLSKLFRLKNKALEKSPIYQAYGNDGKTLRDYVLYAQGGPTVDKAGYEVFKSDCTGKLLNKDSHALPDDFVSKDTMSKDGGAMGKYSPADYAFGIFLGQFYACQSRFDSETGFAGWGKDEK